ncbi:MAG: DUF1573 domain-containing protein [Salibacteraceae bacterium]
MKIIKLAFIAVLALSFSACETGEGDSLNSNIVNNPQTASENGEEVKLPVIEFEKPLQEFGTITQGEKVHLVYEFSNTGEADLVITSARGSCGCTVPDWPKEPIKAGEKGQIKVVFSSEGKSGKQHKKVFVTANTQPAENEVALSGEILVPASE